MMTKKHLIALLLSSALSSIVLGMAQIVLAQESDNQQHTPWSSTITRAFPHNTQFARLEWKEGTAKINGRTLMLAAGFRFRNTENLLQFPSQIQNGVYPVAFLLDPMGQLWQVWQLSPLEVKAVTGQ